MASARINPATPEAIEAAAARLRGGGLVAFPTETVYGLGADATSPEAVARIFAAKGRPATNPLIVHVPDAAAAAACAAPWPASAARLAAALWPGPVTLVVAARPGYLARAVQAGGPTVGLRVPAHPVALALLRAAALPIAAPSANASLHISPTTAAHVAASLGPRAEYILDGGPCAVGLESTVLDCTEAGLVRVLRPGMLPEAALRAALDGVAELVSSSGGGLAPAAQATSPGAGGLAPQRSPGQAERHYAPHTPLEVHTQRAWARVDRVLESGRACCWLAAYPGPRPTAPRLTVRDLPWDDPAEYASQLYAALHWADQQRAQKIVLEAAPPDQPGWAPIHDRLRRAAHR